jgi:hypothetical protein
MGMGGGQVRAAVIPAQTAVEIELLETVSSESLHVGQPVRFKVVTPVMVGGTTVIAAGTPVEGEVRAGHASGAWQRAGWFDLGLKPLLLADGTRVTLDFQRPKVRGVKAEQTGAAIVGGVGLAYYFPLIPVVLIESAKHGKPYNIRAGERYLVQVIASEPPTPAVEPVKEPQTATEPAKPQPSPQ